MKDMQQAQSDITCPITRDIFDHPLLCADGFSYEELAIRKWVAKRSISPMAGTPIANTRLRENFSLLFYINVCKRLNQRLIKLTCVKKPLANNVVKESPLTSGLKKKFEKTLDHYYKSTLDLEKCINMMEEVYNESPTNFQVITDYANILRFSAEFDKSLEMIKKLKLIRPGSLIPEYMQVRVIMEKGRKEEANKLMAKVLSENKVEDHTLLELRFMSYSLLSTGNRDLAYEIVSTYLKVIPNDPRAVSHCIYMNLLREDYKRVIKLSKKYLKAHQNDISILFHQAKAYTNTNKKPKAILIYKQITAVSVDRTLRAKALYESAVIRDCNVEFGDVVKELEESHRLDSREEADAYLAALYTDKGMYDKAEEWVSICSKRIDIDKDAALLGVRAQIQESQGRYEEAIISYLRLAEIDSSNSMYYNSKIEEILTKNKEQD